MLNFSFDFLVGEILMAGKLELGPPKSDVSNPKEQAARKILKIVRSQGHPYVELRENGK